MPKAKPSARAKRLQTWLNTHTASREVVEAKAKAEAEAEARAKAKATATATATAAAAAASAPDSSVLNIFDMPESGTVPNAAFAARHGLAKTSLYPEEGRDPRIASRGDPYARLWGIVKEGTQFNPKTFGRVLAWNYLTRLEQFSDLPDAGRVYFTPFICSSSITTADSTPEHVRFVVGTFSNAGDGKVVVPIHIHMPGGPSAMDFVLEFCADSFTEAGTNATRSLTLAVIKLLAHAELAPLRAAWITSKCRILAHSPAGSSKRTIYIRLALCVRSATKGVPGSAAHRSLTVKLDDTHWRNTQDVAHPAVDIYDFHTTRMLATIHAAVTKSFMESKTLRTPERDCALADLADITSETARLCRAATSTAASDAVAHRVYSRRDL